MAVVTSSRGRERFNVRGRRTPPLKRPPPPDDGARVASRGFRTSRYRTTSTSADDRPQIAQPHRVYVIDRDAILRGELLECAHAISWRYLLIDGEAAVATAEVVDEADGALTLAETNSGPLVQSTVDAIGTAASLDAVQHADFELRLIRVPSVYFAGVWLHRDDADWILPLAPAPAGLDTNRAYAPDEILAAIKPVAERQRATEQS